MSDPSSWSVVEVCSWLRALGLGHYHDAVMNKDVDGAVLLDLIEHDGLCELGIVDKIHQAKVRTRLRSKQSGVAPPSALSGTYANQKPTVGCLSTVGGYTGAAGGYGTTACSIVVETLNIGTGVWTKTQGPPIPSARRDVVAAIGENSLYLMGGKNNQQHFSSVEVLDLTTLTWSGCLEVPKDRYLFGGAVAHGKLYTVGGSEGYMCPGPSYVTLSRAVVEVFDLKSQQWRAGPPMPTGRQNLSVVVVGDKLFAIGGCATYGSRVAVFTTVEMLHLRTGQWTGVLPMPTRRASFGVAVVGHELYVVGGSSDWFQQSPLASVDILNLNTLQWSTGPPMPTARSGLGVAVFGQKLYAIGGCLQGDAAVTAVVEILDLDTMQWTAGPGMPTARTGLGVAVS